jgi:signal transduction histidine kinase
MNIKSVTSKYLDHEQWVAVLAWVLLSSFCLYLLGQREQTPFFSSYWIISAVLFLAFIVCFTIATREQPYKNEPWLRLSLVFIQLVAIFSLYYLIPYSVVAILMTICMAQLPYYTSIRNSVLLSIPLSVPLWLIYQFGWGDSYAWISAILFWAFNLFSIVTMGTRLRETKALEREQAINRELRATQMLLQEASKQNERTRIARDIHDLIGHHLTALSINLQVAARKADDELKPTLEKSQSITKLLLSDVREAVSDLRDSAVLDIENALQSLSYHSADKRVEVVCQKKLGIQSIDIADAVLRISQEAVTNFLKHSNGDCQSISLSCQGDKLCLFIEDNGSTQHFKGGNGLTGMQERANEIGADLSVQTKGRGFSIQLTLEGDV